MKDRTRARLWRLSLPIICAAALPTNAATAKAASTPTRAETACSPRNATRGAAMAVTKTVAFQNAPYPFRNGIVPGDRPGEGTPFFEADADGALFHMAPRGGKLMERGTYDDNRSLLSMPRTFDPNRSDAMIVLFFHGNLATLCDVEGRQGVPRQVAASHANAVLVAPQLARNALDSSPGRFYEPGFFGRYIDEAAAHLADLSSHRFTAEQIRGLPIVIVAYSGGYLATAYALHYAATHGDRIVGVVLLDALFGEEKKFEDWIAATQGKGIFVSGYSASSASLNRDLETRLAQGGVAVCPQLPDVVPAKSIGPGTVAFKPALQAQHNDFVTEAWSKDPLAKLLAALALDGAPGCAADPR